MTRRSLLLGAVGAGTTAIAYPCFYEPRWLETTERRVRLARAPFRSPIRLLHLADLHASLVVPLSLIQNAITLGLNEAPDLICLTGDFITFRHDFDSRAYVSALKRLTAAANVGAAAVSRFNALTYARESKSCRKVMKSPVRQIRSGASFRPSVIAFWIRDNGTTREACKSARCSKRIGLRNGARARRTRRSVVSSHLGS